LLDRIDQKIVALMREDARRSFKDIGDRVSLSAPAVKRRVDRLEREGVIKGYTTTVDHSAFGWHAHAFVELFCEGRMSGAEVREAVMRHPEVEGAYTIAGAPSAIIHVRAEDNQHLEETLERIRETDGVLRTQTQIVLSTLLERPVIESDGKPTKPGRGGSRASPSHRSLRSLASERDGR
jgi:DNA-binding Lrp family transcriptional regulator